MKERINKLYSMVHSQTARWCVLCVGLCYAGYRHPIDTDDLWFLSGLTLAVVLVCVFLVHSRYFYRQLLGLGVIVAGFWILSASTMVSVEVVNETGKELELYLMRLGQSRTRHYALPAQADISIPLGNSESSDRLKPGKRYFLLALDADENPCLSQIVTDAILEEPVVIRDNRQE